MHMYIIGPMQSQPSQAPHLHLPVDLLLIYSTLTEQRLLLYIRFSVPFAHFFHPTGACSTCWSAIYMYSRRVFIDYSYHLSVEVGLGTRDILQAVSRDSEI